MKTATRRNLAPALCACAFLVFQSPLNASPQSEALVKDGLAELKSGRLHVAGQKFTAALKTDPNDGAAAFYLGVALNRLGQHGAALAAFQRMWDLGRDHPELGFEGGWAAVERKQFRTAVTLLEPYVRRNPGNAKAHEFLGRAYIGTRQLDKAESELNEALRLDPALKPGVLYSLGAIASLRGNNAKTAATLDRILREESDSQVGQILRSRMPRKPETQRKPWYAIASVSGGHNSNVIGLPDGSILPSDVSSKDSSFIRTQFDAGYSWRLDDASAVSTGYGLFHDRYNKIEGFDSTSHTLFADYRRRLTSEAEGGVRLSRSLSMTNGDTSVQRTSLSPSATYRWDTENVSMVQYDFALTNYTGDPARRGLDRDSDYHVVTFSHSTRIDNEVLPLGVNFRGGLYLAQNAAEGDDYDYGAVGAFVSIAREIVWKIGAVLSLSREVNGYDNFNSLAGAGFAFKREDRIDRAGLRLERPLDFVDLANVSAFVNFQYLNNTSNIQFFDYTQTTINAGVTARF